MARGAEHAAAPTACGSLRGAALLGLERLAVLWRHRAVQCGQHGVPDLGCQICWAGICSAQQLSSASTSH